MLNKVTWISAVTISLYWFASANVQSQTEHEVRVQEMLSQAGNVTEAQKSQLRLQVESILLTKNNFDYNGIKQPCSIEIEHFCLSDKTVHETLACIKLNRNQVSQICEASLKIIFGGIPFSENKLHASVLLPKGTYFFYDPNSNILGAVVSENFFYKGIEFKKGQVRFHETGLSVAHLLHDQIIDNILFKADGIGPFFNKEGNVVNAMLAEDTEIDAIKYKAGSQIRFSSKGNVESGKLAKDTEITGIVYKADSQISFSPIGNVQSGKLANDVIIDGIRYQTGSSLRFTRNGKIVVYK